MPCEGCINYEFVTSEGIGTLTIISEDPNGLPIELQSFTLISFEGAPPVDSTPSWATIQSTGLLITAGSLYRLTTVVTFDFFAANAADPAEGPGDYIFRFCIRRTDGTFTNICCDIPICSEGVVSPGVGLLYFSGRDAGSTIRYILTLDLENPDDGYTIWASMPQSQHANGIGSLYGIDATNGLAFLAPASGVVDEFYVLAEGATLATELTEPHTEDGTGIDCDDDADHVLILSFIASNDRTHLVSPVDGSETCVINVVELGFAARALHDKARGIISFIIANGSDQGIYKADDDCSSPGVVLGFGFGATTHAPFLNAWFPRLGFHFYEESETGGGDSVKVRVQPYDDPLNIPVSTSFVRLDSDGRHALGYTLRDWAFNDVDEALYYVTDDPGGTRTIWRKPWAEFVADPDRDDYSGGVKSYETEILVDSLNASLFPAGVEPIGTGRPRIPLNTLNPPGPPGGGSGS